jgi:hypothetical protein
MAPVYHLYVSDRGNCFMTEIASLIDAGLGDLGYETVFPAPGLPEPGRDRMNLVIAPHEFFPLYPGVDEATRMKAAAASICVGVEQPGTPWFELSARYAAEGAAVLDISTYAIAELSRRGIDAAHLQLGYHESWDRWGGDPAQIRGTDLLFLGGATPKREKVLSEAAPLIWDRRCDLRLFEFARPMAAATGNFVVGDEKRDLLASARVLLNIHRDEAPYFEWVRALEAVANGCLVISESSENCCPLVPGRHLVVAPADLLASYAASLLADESMRAEMTFAAYELVRSKLEMTSMLQPVCEYIERATTSAAKARRLAVPPAPPLSAPTVPTPSHSVWVDLLESELRMRARVKELIDSEVTLFQQLEALQAQLSHADLNHVDITVTPTWEAANPKVSVLLTSYNYSHFVPEAVRSVLASTGVEAELVIVDDHSSDHSVEVLQKLMKAEPWFPIKLVARAANSGLARGRNTGLAHARGEYVFVLDADNRIYPNALASLSAALDRDPGPAFSYGIIAKFGESGLLSHLPWSVERLCQANYIDAMAMVRRSVLEEVGGWDPGLSNLGWEDYDLWLRLAAEGQGGVLVTSYCGSYRVHPTSMLSTVNLDPLPLLALLSAKYPFLPWSPP